MPNHESFTFPLERKRLTMDRFTMMICCFSNLNELVLKSSEFNTYCLVHEAGTKDSKINRSLQTDTCDKFEE